MAQDIKVQTHPFDLKDKSTWPPLKLPVIWHCRDNYENKDVYVIASLRHEVFPNGEYHAYDATGVEGYECDCILETYAPTAWQHIPTFTLPAEELSNA